MKPQPSENNQKSTHLEDQQYVISQVPLSIKLDDLSRELCLEERPEDLKILRELVDHALEYARPRACYKVFGVTVVDAHNVRIGEELFQSEVLTLNIAGIAQVFPFVVTCGAELDAISPSGADLLFSYWWESIKEKVLREAAEYFLKYLVERYQLRAISFMSPGSGDLSVWPIEQQHQLFKLLGNVESLIGVRLTETYLMVPNKTLSGIAFPSENSFHSCMVCSRAECPSRRAATSPELLGNLRTNLSHCPATDQSGDSLSR